MLSAKSLFLERMHALEKSISIEAVTNKTLTDKIHNDVARMLRNGLAVVGFAALEDFIKLRTSEVLEAIGSTGVPFRDLPERLRIATTYEAITALSYQLSLRPKPDRITYLQDHALKLASTASSAYDLTPLAFGYSQANLQEDVVKEILKSFLITDPWGQMTQLASRLSLTALPLNETFKGAASRRHLAAHVAHVDTPQNDLAQYVKEALAIAISFDTLLTRALGHIRAYDRDYLKNRENTITVASIKIRSIRSVGTVWKEFVEGRPKAVKVEANLSQLLPAARARAISAKDLLVQFGSNGEIVLWECS